MTVVEEAIARERAIRIEWAAIEKLFHDAVSENLAKWVPAHSPHFQQTLTFALGRLQEGRQVANFFSSKGVRGRVLDLGAGNGGVSVAVSNSVEFKTVGLDIVPNNDLLHLRRSLPLPIGQVVGSGHILPFESAAFDVVLCLDTIEHVPRPDLMGPEIMRVLKPGGTCMITTPPRLRYWFARDPHYSIPGLILLPDPLQRLVGRLLLPKEEEYDVVHIFWHVGEVRRHFPGAAAPEVLWNRTYNGPVNLRERLWFYFRHFLWDRILIHKPLAS